MKKLVEVEMDGQACVKQIASLKETMRRLKEVSVQLDHLNFNRTVMV